MREARRATEAELQRLAALPCYWCEHHPQLRYEHEGGSSGHAQAVLWEDEERPEDLPDYVAIWWRARDEDSR